MRVLADSQAIVWYLADDPRIGEQAVAVLDDAVDTDGVCVAAASLIDLWYATHKKGESRVRNEDYERLKVVLGDEESNVDVLPFSFSTVPYVETVPRRDLSDPFDRMIIAAALEYELPLVSGVGHLVTSVLCCGRAVSA